MNKENNNKLIQALKQAATEHPEIKGNHTKLADKAKMNQETVTRILNGTTKDPRISSILKMADACGVKRWELISEEQSAHRIKDDELLSRIMDDFESVFFEKGLNVNKDFPTTKRAKIISIIYNRYVGQALRPAHYKAEVIELFDLVA